MKVGRLIITILMCIILITNISTVYASNEVGQVMILKDGKYIWVDADSEEAMQQEIIGKKREIESAKSVVTAKPTNQKITVDGVPTSFRAYNIEGYNYFMLRDIAHIFKGTKAQCEVGWDQAKFAINLETGKTYTGVGEGFNLKTPHVEEKGTKSEATIYKNGKEVLLLGYTIEGYTYFKLRDLGEELGFGVDWDNLNKIVVLLSDKDAVKEEPKPESKPEPNPHEMENPLDKVDTTPFTESEKQAMREHMLSLINDARKKEGLNPLVLDDNLTKMADYKAADMHKLDKMTHDGSYGTFKDLLSMYNAGGGWAGENILRSGVSVGEMFNSWMRSSGHRANILHPEFRKLGVGFYEHKPVTKGMGEVPSDLIDIAIYNEVTGRYEVSGMGLWGVQHFTD